MAVIKKRKFRYLNIHAEATNQSMAWMFIRNKCHELKIPVPTIEKVKETVMGGDS